MTQSRTRSNKSQCIFDKNSYKTIMSSVRYKFENTLSYYDTITFAGNFISLTYFKDAVVKQKKLNKVNDDLKVVNADTNHEFKFIEELIPRNTTLIVSRKPRTLQSNTPIIGKRNIAVRKHIDDLNKIKNVDFLYNGPFIDLTQLNISEEKKIGLMMGQSTSGYNPKTYQNDNKASFPVPKTLQCSRCFLTGHWVSDCPVGKMVEINVTLPKKAGTDEHFQIPTFLQKERKYENNCTTPLFTDKAVKAPDDMLCPICKEICSDPAFILCCRNLACDDCIRSADNECPFCKETDLSPESQIPNRFPRKPVQFFKWGFPENTMDGTVAKDTLDQK